MGVIEKVIQEDLCLFEILKNPVLATEFIYNLDDSSKKFEWTLYQKEVLCDFSSYVSICFARSVGKTESLVGIILWALIFNIFPNDYILYTVPNKVHLEPVFTKLIRFFRSNSFLKHFIEPKGGINNSDFTIRLLNNAVLLCRIAGQTGTGANVVGLHTPFEILDESSYYNWGTYIELQPTLNTFTPGFRFYVSGVPNGIREKNVCYHADMENSSFSKHRASAFDNPRFSEEDKQRAIEQYGGDDSDDYIHLVLGKHGRPIFSLFDRTLFEIAKYPVYKLVIDGQEFGEDLTLYYNKLSLFPNIEYNNNGIIFGIDLGYTEPSAFVILYIDPNNRIKFHGRIRLNKVSLGIQDRIIDYLDTRFNPSLLGVDSGGLGAPITQRLKHSTDYLHKNYDKRLFAIVPNENIVIGKTPDGDDITNKAKPLAISVLQEYSNNHKIVYSSTDLEMVTELERMTYARSSSGEIIYRTLSEKGGKRGEDHFTSALLYSILAHYLTNEIFDLRGKSKKLAKPHWFIGI